MKDWVGYAELKLTNLLVEAKSQVDHIGLETNQYRIGDP
jgi:hypothetical protein